MKLTMARRAVQVLAGTLLAASVLPANQSTKRAPAAAEVPSLSREIEHQLRVLPYYSVFDNVRFTLKGAAVTLTGEVTRLALKSQAEAAVKSLEGVARVTNQIEVLPASASDDELRRSVYRAIYENPQLARYAAQALPAIRIIVRDGKVTLEGNVASAGDKALAGARASSVANVRSVTNNLMVQSKASAGE